MEFDKINRLTFETLECIAAIETSRVLMFNPEDRYSHVPFFRFKFKNIKKDDLIYEKIQASINNFVGNLKWKLLTRFDSENFLIIPIIFQENNIAWDDKDSFISLLGESSYRTKIDECIDDIPRLAKAISRSR